MEAQHGMVDCHCTVMLVTGIQPRRWRGMSGWARAHHPPVMQTWGITNLAAHTIMGIGSSMHSVDPSSGYKHILEKEFTEHI